jgi:hypothetical protein
MFSLSDLHLNLSRSVGCVIKLKALSMEGKNANLWWDAGHDIVQKNIGKVCIKYERNERIYRHRISHMEKKLPSFEYEPLVMSRN